MKRYYTTAVSPSLGREVYLRTYDTLRAAKKDIKKLKRMNEENHNYKVFSLMSDKPLYHKK